MAFAPPFQRPFSATFDRRAAAAGNGLLNALIAYWPGNEASGNLLDAHTNGLHLTDVNTVTNAAGKVYSTARQYTAANNEYHTRNSQALLQTGDVDFSFAAWCYADSLSALAGICGKFQYVNYEYRLSYNPAVNRLRFSVSPSGAAGAIVNRDADTLGAPQITTWYLIVGWHDSVANTINVQVNNSAVDSTSYTDGVYAGTAAFTVGSIDIDQIWNGRIGPVAFWKSAAGGGGVLTTAQRTALWNNGNGLAYSQFTT